MWGPPSRCLSDLHVHPTGTSEGGVVYVHVTNLRGHATSCVDDRASNFVSFDPLCGSFPGGWGVTGPKARDPPHPWERGYCGKV